MRARVHVLAAAASLCAGRTLAHNNLTTSPPTLVSSPHPQVVLLGDTGVGKSSLVLRFVTNSFDKYSESTIG